MKVQMYVTQLNLKFLFEGLMIVLMFTKNLPIFSLKGTTTGEDLFESIDKSLNNLGLEWKKLVSVTTDGGKNMSGLNKGVVGRIKKKMLQNDYEIPMNFHRIIPQEA